MPTIAKNNMDGSVIHKNEYTTNSFNSSALVEDIKNIDVPSGKGTLSQWYFDGIRILHSRWNYNSYQNQQWESDLDIVSLNFNLKGKVSITDASLGNGLTLNALQCNMFYSNGYSGALQNMELTSELFILQFTKQAFLQLTQSLNDRIRTFGDKILKGGPVYLYDTHFFMDINMQNVIHSIINCPFKDGLKKMFLLSKCIELLVLQSEAFNNVTAPKFFYCKTQLDQDRLVLARDYIREHLYDPPSLSELAKIVGTNEAKLKGGFREIFKTTVFGYLADLRLASAQKELKNTQKTISEIADELGYSSIHHFSNAFKKKFGISPSLYR
jgi:AraC-like DNA-binding protein